MKHFPRYAALALATATLLAAGCQPGDKPGAENPAAEATVDGDSTVLKIPGLETEKEQISYMIGMDIGKSLETVKEDVDLATLNQALETVLAGETPLMTEAQADQVREAFGRKMQAQQIAEMMATAKQNKAEGVAFLAANADKPGVETTDSGLQYKVLTPGDGATPEPTDTVRVHYKGSLLDGETFDSSYERDEPVVFALDQVVPGWQEGIAMMSVGSKYQFWIPSELGYGERGTPGGPIGPNQVLVFEVELLDIVDQSGSPDQAPPAQ